MSIPPHPLLLIVFVGGKNPYLGCGFVWRKVHHMTLTGHHWSVGLEIFRLEIMEVV